MDDNRLLQQIWDSLRCVEDPEIHLNIVDLGLIYGVTLVPIEEGFKAVIEMTLTSPTCPMAPYIFQNIHESIEFLDGIVAVDIQLIWDPPWCKDRISEAGKMEIGLL